MRPSLVKQNVQAKEVDFDTQLKQEETKTSKPYPKKRDSVEEAREKRKNRLRKCFPLLIYTSLNFLTGLKPSKCPGKKGEEK